jgi:hypothetical protein
LFFRKVLEVSEKNLFLGVIYTERFAAYKIAVVSAYLQKRDQAQEDWLIKPTRGRIRQLCCKLVEDGLEKRDEKMLREYLKMQFIDHDFLAAIKKTDVDDFQGLLQFLNKTEINPAEIKVELMAWLIDFPARPFSQYIKEPRNELKIIKEEVEVIPPVQQEDAEDPDTAFEGQEGPVLKKEEVVGGTVQDNITKGPTPEGKGKEEPAIESSNKIDRRWLIGIAVLLIGAVILWRVWPGGKKCMYWDNDHYMATSCNVPRLDTPLVPLDQAKLRGFRRIKRVDTLTRYSVDRLWYVRVEDSLEIYSAGGTHPLYPDKRLQAVTDYVVNFCHNRSKYGKP